MNRIQLYIFRQVGAAAAFAAVALTLVIWLAQSHRMLEAMISQNQSLITFLELSALVLPQLAVQTLPFALLIAVLFVFARLERDSELVAMWAAGATRWFTVAPLIAVALLATFAAYLLTVYVMPAGMREMRDQMFDIRNDIIAAFVSEGTFTTPFDSVTVYVNEKSPNGDLRGIFVHDARNPEHTLTYLAQSGAIDTTGALPQLILHDGTIERRDANAQSIQVLDFKRYALDLGQFENARPRGSRDKSERYLGELLDPGPKTTDAERRQYFAEAQDRLSTPLYCLLFTLIAAAAFLGPAVDRNNLAPRLALAGGVAIIARLPAFTFHRMTEASSGAAFDTYTWPALWIAVALAVLLLRDVDLGALSVGNYLRHFGFGGLRPPSSGSRVTRLTAAE